jgi:hypothetical protein
MIKIKAATTSPYVIGKKMPSAVRIVHPAAKKI